MKSTSCNGSNWGLAVRPSSAAARARPFWGRWASSSPLDYGRWVRRFDWRHCGAEHIRAERRADGHVVEGERSQVRLSHRRELRLKKRGLRRAEAEARDRSDVSGHARWVAGSVDNRG